jgi:hypothetical protein
MPAVIVLTERRVIGKMRHDLTVYRTRKRSMPYGFAPNVSRARNDGINFDKGTAHAEGLAALEDHVKERHDG